MGHTYGESWAFFHANTNSSTLNEPRPITTGLRTNQQDLQAARTESQPTQHAVSSDNVIRAQIRELQQELDERRRSVLPEPTVEQQIQIPQQSDSLPAPPCPATNNSNVDTSEPYRCWGSCCNGRTFSNKSNFARHQREKRRGRDAADLKCSFCGVGFTRATARHAHEAERRCRNSGGSASIAR